MANPTPAISFQVNLAYKAENQIGTLTNETTYNQESPDQWDNSPDRGREATAARSSTFSTFVPTFQIAPNRVLKHGDTFTEYGMKAVYLRKTYGIGYAPSDRAVLTVVSVD